MGKVWVEAALNGPWGRERQKGIPVSVDEIVADGLACASEGAAIIHVHAYDTATGRQNDDWQTYARIIEGIRSKVDAIVYPTIPLAGSAFADLPTTKRFAHTAELATRGLIEWTVLDPGSVNFQSFGEPLSGFIYANTPDDIVEGLKVLRQYGLHPGFAIYEPGFTRLGAALARLPPAIPQPVYRFMFSDGFAWGFPPQDRFLDAHLALLKQEDAAAPWMVAGLRVDIRPLIEVAVRRGGHVRVGLEDAPWGTGLSNLQWTKEAVRLIAGAGGTVATAADIRARLRPRP